MRPESGGVPARRRLVIPGGSMDLSVPCVRCGKPAAEHGEHHEPRKGMGGQGPKAAEHPRVPLCRGCHRELHDGRFRLRLEANVAVSLSPEGDVLAVRAVRPQPFVHAVEPPEVALEELAQALVLADDESLAYVWECGARWQGTGDLIQAVAAWAFRRRYGSYGQAWYRRVAELIREATGLHVSVGAVYDAAARGVALEAAGWRLDLLDLGKTVLAEVGKAPEPAAALEAAHALRDEGLLARQVVAELRSRREADFQTLKIPAADPEGCAHEWRCARCGARMET